MALGEFDIIARYFKQPPFHKSNILLSVGDDAALVSVPEGLVTAVSIDTSNAGVHFPLDTSPYDIGYKALAVNLSDIAAMGATPAWFTLALSLPDADEKWLGEFSQGLFALASRYQIDLIGGDTTRGPLSITIQIAGWVNAQCALRRSGAKVGDLIYVSGTLGDAAAGLAILQGHISITVADTGKYLLQRLHQPQPRNELGILLSGVAHACIDVSDGLAADLGHILEESQVAAVIYQQKLPMSDALKSCGIAHERKINFQLHGGDDYELCFTVPAKAAAAIEEQCKSQGIAIHCIGEIVAGSGLRFTDEQGNVHAIEKTGYQHFYNHSHKGQT